MYNYASDQDELDHCDRPLKSNILSNGKRKDKNNHLTILIHNHKAYLIGTYLIEGIGRDTEINDSNRT
jgi:hypothetical protein